MTIMIISSYGCSDMMQAEDGKLTTKLGHKLASYFHACLVYIQKQIDPVVKICHDSPQILQLARFD